MTENTQRPSEVHVQKNDLPLQSGQTVNAFTRELSDMVRAQLTKTQGLDKLKKEDHGHVWVMDIFAENVVAEVSKYEKAKSPSHTNTFFSMAYARDNNGVLKLGDEVEVVRRVTYVPKAPTLKSITKCEVSKSFWAGVL